VEGCSGGSRRRSGVQYDVKLDGHEMKEGRKVNTNKICIVVAFITITSVSLLIMYGIDNVSQYNDCSLSVLSITQLFSCYSGAVFYIWFAWILHQQQIGH